MTSPADLSAAPRLEERRPDEAARPFVTGPELLALGAVLLVALLGWAALALAHLGRHSLVAVLLVTAAAAVPLVLLARRRSPGLRRDGRGLLVALGCAAVAAALTFPGFSYGVGDKDPGGYVNHAVQISRDGSYSFTDPVLARDLPVQLQSPGARFPGVWIAPESKDKIVPQFYHLWPSLLATAHDAGGRTALLWTVPVAGVLSVLLLVALLRRIGDELLGPTAGLVAAGAGGLLLATNMMQVWQSRYPTTEVLAQALYLGALLGVVLAVRTGWRAPAGAAGLLVGIGWLNRADGVLLVLLAAGLGALLVAARRWDARAWWFVGGLGVVVPHAALQAYDLARHYTKANPGPTALQLVGVVVALLLVALAVRATVGPWLVRLAERRRAQVTLGFALCAACALLLAVGFLRPRLFGIDYFHYNGQTIRSYDEQVLRRLSWFFTLPGFALFGLGIAVVALRRWLASAWLLVLPTLALTAVYGYTASNSSRMLWWSRRYVPTVTPGFLALVALCLAFAFAWRWRGRAVLRVPALLAFAFLVASSLSHSLPLRGHDEFRGSFALTERLSRLSGDARGVYLWQPGQPCCFGPTALLATPVWLQHDELSVLLPNDPGMRAGIVEQYRQAFPDSPVFVLAQGDQLPEGVDPATVEPVDRIQATLPFWEESDVERPDEAKSVRVDVGVWRVTGP